MTNREYINSLSNEELANYIYDVRITTQNKLYRTWIAMRQRCNNPSNDSYKDYGGRGITVCELWNDYDEFKRWALSNGYQDNLSIDRIDNGKGYEPDNCRWATDEEQANNKRSNVNVSYNGETHNIHQWAKILNIKESTLRERFRKRWDAEKALNYDGQGRKLTLYEYNGRTQSLRRWAMEKGLNYQTLISRVDRYGWAIDKALETPAGKYERKIRV